MKLSEFNYHLPKDLIAQHPLSSRDNSRLMILDRKNSSINHNTFSNFPDYFYKGDLLVLNNTKVFPAKLIGKKNTGGKVEILLTQEIEPGIWKAMIKSSGKLKENTEITFSLSGVSAVIVGKDKSNLSDEEYRAQRLIQFDSKESAKKILDKVGLIPLPPFIKRNQGKPSSILDKERYQTVYASKVGAIAAPTAGLHFTEDILSRLKKKGVEIAEVTLHVGA
ncbi:MAG: S-adenosylmethionine:tRNA ribosyltransferase-isomerase, partial [Nitrospinota bacterium]|nr:S-adenosylmethionine:tRNA ribosyltransferase-isomerase [Nitrospinota bacterium]